MSARATFAALAACLCAGCPGTGPAGSGPDAGAPAGLDAGPLAQGDSGPASAADAGPSAGDDAGPAAPTECEDGVDNDGDGLVDWQHDLGCANRHDDDEAAAPRDQEGGFSTFDPVPGAKVVFVSSTEGDDSRDGSSPALAVKTLARGASLVRDGQPDFLLLRRGDVWRGETLGRFKSGLDAARPLVLASYGESTLRPRLELTGELIDHNGKERSFVAVLGLEVVAAAKVPGDPAFDGATGSGLRYVGGGKNLLVEGCRFRFSEIVVQSYDALRYTDVELRRNVVEHSYHVDTCGQSSTYRPSGVYSSHVDGLTLEGNLFDHNGWSEEVSSACASMYNHNLYLNADRLLIRDNVIARASSMGIKMRSDVTGDADDLVFEDNLLVDGEIGIGIGGNTSEPRRFTNVAIRRNVFSQVGMGNPTGRSFSWMLDVAGVASAVVEENHFLHQPWFDNAYGLQLSDELADVTVARNLFYDLRRRALSVKAAPGWSGVAVTGNTFVDPSHGSCLVDHAGGFAPVTYSGNRYSGGPGADWFCVDGARQSLSQWQASSGESGATSWTASFPAPDRTVAGYAASLGLPGTLQGFLDAARLQDRLSWDERLTAGAVNGWIRAGFE